MSTPKAPPRTRLLLLDACGVVLNDPLYDVLAEVARATHQERAAVIVRYTQIRDEFWSGVIGEPAFWASLGAGGASSRWTAALVDAFTAGPAAPHLARWGAHTPLWMLSNHRAAWLHPVLDRLGLRDAFARIHVSDTLGVAKPVAAAYRMALAEFDGAPHEVLFIDDKARNLDAAARLGLDTLLADPAGAWLAELDARLGVAAAA